jgi:hypothetical protein
LSSTINLISGIDKSDTRTALILNSRQGKQPLGSERWVENTCAATAYAIGKNYTLITSFGINTYDLVAYLGAAYDARMILLVPSVEMGDMQTVMHVLDQFNLNASKVSFLPIETDTRTPKGWWLERDRTAIGLSDLILPVSVNPTGNLAEMIEDSKGSGATIDDRFSVRYERSSRRLYSPVYQSSLAITRDSPWPYITHWTRSFNGPWPGQKLHDYYRMVTCSEMSYSHSGPNSLKNILQCGVIFGTSQRIRQGYNVVSFTDHHPAEAIKLMKWRARFVRWNFEPYGVAIDRAYAEFLGIRPVIYGASSEFAGLPERDKPYFQNLGEKGGDWKPEQEWRFHGNLSLGSIPPDKMRIIVRKESEIFAVEGLTSSEIVALTNEDN